MVRSAVYGASFMAAVVVGLPYLFLKLDGVLGTAGLSLPAPLRYAGLGFAGLAWAGYVACSAYLMIHGRGPYVEFDPPKEFVATGPFRWCRNPVAGTLVLGLAGEAVYLSSVGVGILAVLAGAAAHLQVSRLEEPLLTKRFGKPYEEYLRTVPRWWPKPPGK